MSYKSEKYDMLHGLFEQLEGDLYLSHSLAFVLFFYLFFVTETGVISGGKIQRHTPLYTTMLPHYLNFQVVRMLIALVVAFAVFWGPAVIGNFFLTYWPQYLNGLHGVDQSDLVVIFYLISLTGCCINPYVYALFSK